eukprot:s2960_g3.t1
MPDYAGSKAAAVALQLKIDADTHEDEEDRVLCELLCSPPRIIADHRSVEVEGKSTMKSWNMTALPGVPLPPNRRMHEQHQRRLDRRLGDRDFPDGSQSYV